MSRLIRAAVALAIAASAAGAARAQTGAPVDLSEMRPLLEAQARQAVALLGRNCAGGPGDGTSSPDHGSCTPRKTPIFTKLLSFVPLQFALTDAPRVKYDLVPGYAFYAARCTPAATAMMALNQAGGMRGPTVGHLAMNVAQVLPSAPVLPGDTSAVVDMRRRVDLGVLPPPPQYVNPIVLAWGEGASQGHYRAQASTPVLPSGAPPMLGDGVLVVAVTPWFDLQDANYTATVAAGEALVNGSERVGVPLTGYTAVRGQVKGGRWAQGSGLLYIPAPKAVSGDACTGPAFTQPADAALLARFGIQPGQPFERPGAIFVRTTAH